MLRNEISRPSMKRMNKVSVIPIFSLVIQKIFVRAINVEIILYLMIGIGGYYGMCNQTEDVITKRPALPGNKDYLMLAARFCFPLYLAVGIPLNASPLRLLLS